MAAENNNHKTLIGQVEDHLRRQIRDGELSVGSKLPSMRHLSQTMGCSLGIVQMAINTLTAEGYLRSLPRQGVFVAEPPNRKRDIALVLPSVSLEPMGAIIRGVRKGLVGTDLHLLIQASDNDFDDQVHLLDHLDKDYLAGVIICPPTANEYVKPLQKFASSGIPCVQATFRLDGLDMNTVCWDGFESGRMAAQHIISKGHTKIGLVGFNSDSRTAKDVLDGLDSVFKTKGFSAASLPHCNIDQLKLDADQPWMNSERSCIKFLAEHTDLTAVIASGHYLALGAYRAANALDIKIPDRLSVLSMGSDIQAFTLIDPPVSIVDNRLESVCERAMMRLLQIIEGDRGPSTTIQIPPQLIERGSVKSI